MKQLGSIFEMRYASAESERKYTIQYDGTQDARQNGLGIFRPYALFCSVPAAKVTSRYVSSFDNREEQRVGHRPCARIWCIGWVSQRLNQAEFNTLKLFFDAGVAELLVFHPVDTIAKRLMSNKNKVRFTLNCIQATL